MNAQPLSAPISAAERADYCFLTRVIDEARRARRKFPAPNTTFAATVEEMGEVGTALMDLQKGRDTREHFVEECVQLAAMALRMAVEGDPTFPASLPRENEPLDDFLAECTLRDGEASVNSRFLRDRYIDWCRARGVVPHSVFAFAHLMHERGYRARYTGVSIWIGISLVEGAR
jgi:hypothetical protein